MSQLTTVYHAPTTFKTFVNWLRPAVHAFGYRATLNAVAGIALERGDLRLARALDEFRTDERGETSVLVGLYAALVLVAVVALLDAIGGSL